MIEDGKIVCPKCEGSGFRLLGSCYGDLCDCCGGYIGLAPNDNEAQQTIDLINGEGIALKVNLYNGTILYCSDRGVYSIEDRKQDTITIINQDEAIATLVDTVQDLGHWLQVAKDILPEEQFKEIQDVAAAD